MTPWVFAESTTSFKDVPAQTIDMIHLRDYQRDLLGRVNDALRRPGAKIMLQLPTGGGKTHIASELLSSWLPGGYKAVWLTHRRELVTQTAHMLEEAGVPVRANTLWNTNGAAPSMANGAVILMAQTVSRRNSRMNVWGNYDLGDLLLIDEAHHATAQGWKRAMAQWPGRVLGMTATPWRLSQKEGFEHLFTELHCGPQVAALQSAGWLCQARVVLSPEDQRVRGGQSDSTGDYSESGITLANEDRDVWTAGAFRFWQERCGDRQTLVYAVSVAHADNLHRVFNKAGVTAGVLLGETPSEERARLIEGFQNGTIRVIINVSVATEGFDLPDAGCVILLRPTLSLALYLQMVGRGLRPKPDDGDCVILDLSGNSLRHGLPEEERQWSLRPRGEGPSGVAPLIRCPQCSTLSSLGSHECRHCGVSFGEPCDRCGAWRAWKRWSRKAECGDAHDQVCDLCHEDAHTQARLPVTTEIRELAKLQSDDELPPQRDPFLRNLLEEERRRLTHDSEERKEELRRLVEVRRQGLANDNELDRMFQGYVNSLPLPEQPQTRAQRSRSFTEWEGNLKQELEAWEGELRTLQSQPVDGPRIFNNARERLMQLLEAEAREAGLLENRLEESSSGDTATTLLFRATGEVVSLSDWNPGMHGKPVRVVFPDGKERLVGYQYEIAVETTKWLMEKGFLTRNDLPIRRARKFLVAETPVHPDGKHMRLPHQAGPWVHVECSFPLHYHIKNAQEIIRHAGQNPAQFLLSSTSSGNEISEPPQSRTSRGNEILVSKGERMTGARFCAMHGIQVRQARYHVDGTWYARLSRFPAALCDAHGYVRFNTERDFLECPYLPIGKQVGVPNGGISAIPGYRRVD